MKDKSLYCLIMAGGVGSRFWPLSTETNPKQFQDFLGTGKSLLQMTFNRFVESVPVENIFILTNEAYVTQVVAQLGVPRAQIICEPERKNTAPCIAFATAKILQKDQEAVMIVTPSDHLITNESQFNKDLSLGVKYAVDTSSLITFGIEPHRPDTGYGYIEFNTSKVNERTQKVLQFREKPDLKTAESFLKQGNFYWNSGMFIWKGEVVEKSFKKHAPSLYQIFFEDDAAYNKPDETQFMKRAFTSCDSVSIDYAIMEKEEQVIVVLSKFGWSDLGTWGSVKTLTEKDSNDNSLNHDNIHLFDSTSCFVIAEKEKEVLIDGLNDFIIIDTKDKLMILKEENEQRLKEYLSEIKNKKLKNG
ncbi:MAG: mannose-1-phosphate guanylyltransferase [Crocinitomicaceae bacterium]|nr:mannose-1-phosphate guanylyltransferase [Crocinitomicaceae bacterium]MDG1734561.1 mannose-1-phosphate guanylyltransferase [Crocinitomicaceae bacterium]